MNPSRFGSSGFSPLELNPEVWLDVNDPSTVTKDGSDYISQLDDKSGNGNNYTQPTGSLQPLWSATMQNGLSGFICNNDWMGLDSFASGTLSRPITICAVIRMPAYASDCAWDSNDSGSINYLFNNATTSYLIGSTPYLIGGTMDSANTLVYVTNVTTTSGYLRRSKSELMSGASGSQTMIGSNLGVSNNRGDGLGDFRFCEFYLINSTLSTEQLDSVETYLTDKWIP